MQCISLRPDGTLQTEETNTDGTCSAYVLLNQSDYSLMVQSYTITPEQVANVFSWGFGVVLLFWSLGYVIGVAKTAISKL
jgi:hypothetical protein